MTEDFEKFEITLLQNPEQGDLIPEMGGLRKIRLKSSAKGKRGGFRLDYLDFPEDGITYYVVIYPKNVKDDLNSKKKRSFQKWFRR